MKKIIIWGTGEKAKRLCNYLDFNEVEIIGFTDNSGVNDKELWNGYKYIPRRKALTLEYDYIVIASVAFCDIASELMFDCGVDRSSIIQANNVQFMIPNTLFFFNQIELDPQKYSIFTDINSFSCEIV